MVTQLFKTISDNFFKTYLKLELLSRNSWQSVSCLQKVVIILLTIVICLMGTIIKIKEPNLAPPIAFIYFMDNHLAVGAKGLVIAGLLVVVMSTADSWLNNASSLCTYEVVNKFVILTYSQALLVTRMCTAIIAV
ncbi:MAG: hypothetical protein MRQ07_05580 [Candidatus Midichloria sp.]|nr:hypothetical protein [Candidatus Midichloria sp.]